MSETYTHTPTPGNWVHPHTAEEIHAEAITSLHYDLFQLLGIHFSHRDTTLIISSLGKGLRGEYIIGQMEATPNEHGEWWCEYWFTYENQPQPRDTTTPLSLIVHRHTNEPDHAEYLQHYGAEEPWLNYYRALARHLDTRETARHTA